MVDQGEIDLIIVSFFDRLARDAYEFIVTISTLNDKGISVVSIREDYSTKNMEPLHMAFTGVQVELENQQRTKRLYDGRIDKEKKGVYMCGRTPFGYIKNKEGHLNINTEEANLVQLIFEKYNQGISLTNIIKLLRERFANKNWSSTVLNRILSNMYFARKKCRVLQRKIQSIATQYFLCFF